MTVALLIIIAWLLACILRQLRSLTRTVITLYNGAISGTDKPVATVKGK